MPYAIALPPRLVDHTFPRSEAELREVSVALGEIVSLAQQMRVLVVSNEAFKEFVAGIDWRPPGVGMKREIDHMLSLLLLNGQAFTIDVDLSAFRTGSHHPSPVGLDAACECVALWTEEMAAMLRWHDQFAPHQEFYIGVACGSAFSGQALGAYPAGVSQRCFPLVGPTDMDQRLLDADRYITPAGSPVVVSFSDAKKHLHLLGGVVHSPSNGSHYSVAFRGARTWTLDPNNDPVPVNYLAQLKAITGLPLSVVCLVLATGRFPPTRRFYTS